MRLKPLNSFKKENPVAFLTKRFFKEQATVLQVFSPNEQLALTEHFIEMMDCLEQFANNVSLPNGTKYADQYLAAADALLNKYGSRFKVYTEQDFIQYFLPPMVLIVKGYYDLEEIQRGETAALSLDEAKAFAFICKAQLNQNRIALLASDAHILTDDTNTNNGITQTNQQQSDVENDATNQKLLLMVEDKLSPFKDSFNHQVDYTQAVQAITHFLDSGRVYSGEVLFVKGGVVKKLAYALGDIWRSHSNEIISVEYLILYTRLFSIFSKIEIDQSNLFSNNLYKYSISKT